MLLDEEIPIGRKKLAQTLGIGEGSTRTILSLLNEQKYITTDKTGILLTQKGHEFKSSVYIDVSPVIVNDLTINSVNYAVRIPHAAKKVTYGCEERDIAIRSGATGATTLVCTNGSLIFPGSEYPVEKTVEASLKSVFPIKNDDVIIIGTANEPDVAECGAVSAALNIIGGLNIRTAKDIFMSNGLANVILSLAFSVHDLVGGLPVCAKTKDDLGIRIENGAVIDNAYTGDILEQCIDTGETIRTVARSGPYKGVKVIVAPIEIEGSIVASIGVVDIKGIADESTLMLFGMN